MYSHSVPPSYVLPFTAYLKYIPFCNRELSPHIIANSEPPEPLQDSGIFIYILLLVHPYVFSLSNVLNYFIIVCDPDQGSSVPV